MKKILSKYLMNYVEDCTESELEEWLMVPPTKEMGDFSLPCFQLAKRMHLSPKMIAEEIKAEIEQSMSQTIKQEMNQAIKQEMNQTIEQEMNQSIISERTDCEALEEKITKENESFLQRVEVVNGYLNFCLKESWYRNWLLQESITNVTEKMSEGIGKTVCIDYSSPNIAKNFHIGHLRTTIIGNSLYKIYQKLGYHMVGINHLGDWGTQFGKLIVSYKKWGTKEQVEKGGIDELLRLYVMFHTKVEENPELIQEARDWFLKMEQKDAEAMELWQWFKDISMIEFQEIYDLLRISFDSYSGESVYMEQVAGVVELLKEKELLVESEGANVVLLEDIKLPPCLITKSDGTSIYPSRDLAAVLHRKEVYDFWKCLYVTGAEQQLHFNQVFQVIRKMGYEWWEDLVHIPYGLVSVQGEKLSTRNGTIVFAKDLLEEAISRAMDIIEEKNPMLSDKEKVAKQVGIGAVVFHELYNVRIKNVSFSWEQVLNFDGATGPYIQYTYARANRMIQKNGGQEMQKWLKEQVSHGMGTANEENESYGMGGTKAEEESHGMGTVNADKVSEYSKYYTEDVSKQILELLTGYQGTIKEAAMRYEPCVIARFAYHLAQDFNQFYQECNIQNAEPACKQARLFLACLTQHTIKDAMALLGIECPEEM